jgi:PadR family transcriptional regulator PadR
MPLHFGVDILFSKDGDEAFERTGFEIERAVFTSGKTDQSGREFGEVFVRGGAFALFCAEIHTRQKTAKILVAGSRFGQQRIAPAIHASYFCADVRFDSELLGGHVKTHDAGDAIAVEERERGLTERGAGVREIFRQGRAFKEAEGGAGVHFDIHISSFVRLHNCGSQAGGSQWKFQALLDYLQRCDIVDSREEHCLGKPTDLVQGTLDLLILKTISQEPMNGWAIAKRIVQVSNSVLQVQQGSLYPALHRLENHGWIQAEWKDSENKRRAKFYSLTAAGRKRLKAELETWRRLSGAIGLVIEAI